MRTPEPALGRFGRIACAVLLLSGGGCSTPVAQSRRTSQEAAVTSGKGAAITVELVRGGNVLGELIAVSNDQILVLHGRALTAVPTREVKRATLGVFGTNEDTYGAWTGAGAVSTLTHGGFLIFTLPLWLVSGILSSNVEANRGIVEYPPNQAPVFRRYARFPQGLPPGVDVASLLDSRAARAPAEAEAAAAAAKAAAAAARTAPPPAPPEPVAPPGPAAAPEPPAPVVVPWLWRW